MKVLLLLSFFLLPINSLCQEFEFPMIFVDAVGNSDTITLGLSHNSTVGIDENIGELNISELAIADGIDVRITNEIGFWYDPIAIFHTKKQIINTYAQSINIDIFTKNWPVTAYWDNQLFQQDFVRGTFLTSSPEGYWFDFFPGNSDLSLVVLKERNSITFTANAYPDWIDDEVSYVIGEDTASVFTLRFWDRDFGTNNKNIDSEEINIFPNPSSEFINLEYDEQTNFKTVGFYTIHGVLVKKVSIGNQINISDLDTGTYLIRMIGDAGSFSKLFVKQ